MLKKCKNWFRQSIVEPNQTYRSPLGFIQHLCILHHRSFWVKAARFVVAMALLFIILYLGKLIATFVPVGIPDSIWGLLILFVLLLLKVVKIEWVSPATRPILRYMTLFFLPVCSGILEQGHMLTSHLSTVFLANFLSTVLALIVVGYLAQWLFRNAELNNE